MNISLINGYYMAYFMLDGLQGNAFVSGIILGTAEAVAIVTSGIVLQYVREDKALRIFCTLATVSNFALAFATTTTQTYIIFLFAVAGLAGISNCQFVNIEMQMSP